MQFVELSKKIETDRITVVGGAVVDLKASPRAALLKRSSNIGTIKTSLGGVGFNIARSLAMLDCSVFFISALASDLNGELIRTECNKYSNLRSKFCEGRGTALYSAILDESGELYAAVSDMDVFQELTPKRLYAILNSEPEPTLLVTDTNITPDALQFLADFTRSRGIPLIADPTAADKTFKLYPILQDLYMITPNEEELDLLVSGSENWQQKSKRLLEMGVQNILLSLGNRGVAFINSSGIWHQESIQCDVVDVTGAGDTLLAAFITELSQSGDIDSALKSGVVAAVSVVEIPESVNSELSKARIQEYKGELF